MKKLLILTGIISMLFGISAHAANGDIAGHIYSTDIRAYINGVEVPSCNIGGRTAVVIEDIANENAYSYNDDLRALFINTLAPESLNEGNTESAKVSGNIIGNVYETDIKTYIYDTILPSYNIGGKTAVVIEDLGGNQEFSDIGGRYVWDADARTISLEFMYDSNIYGESLDLMRENNVSMTVTDGHAELKSDFLRSYINGNLFDTVYENGGEGFVPISADIDGEETVIGYFFMKSKIQFVYYEEENKYKLEKDQEYFEYFYPDKLRAAVETVTPAPPTREEVIEYQIESGIATVRDRIDTDSYSFLYMTQSTPHGGNTILLYVMADGKYHNFTSNFNSISMWGTISFDKLDIDKENEKVYIHYDNDYILDLKTCRLTYSDGSEYSLYPPLPETDRAHYVIYKEGYRDGRTELAVFDTDADSITYDANIGEYRLYPDGTYENEIKYYLDGDEWVEFERGYERISNNAWDVMESSLDVVNKNKRYITCFGTRR